MSRVTRHLGYGVESVRPWVRQADIDNGCVSVNYPSCVPPKSLPRRPIRYPVSVERSVSVATLTRTHPALLAGFSTVVNTAMEMLLSMSSGHRGGFEKSEEVAGVVPLQAAPRFPFGLAVAEPAGDIVLCRLMVLRSGQDDGVQRTVELAVTPAGETVASLGLTRGRFKRCNAAEACDAVRRSVTEHIDVLIPERDKRVRLAERQAARLKDERDALLRAHYAGAVPLDQLRDEQQRITAALAAAERELSARRLERNQLTASLKRALSLLSDAHSQYARSAGRERRQMNQAVFRRVFIYDDQITDVEGTDLFQRLLAPDLDDRLRIERHGSDACNLTDPTKDAGPDKRKNLRPEPQVVGSNFSTLVALSQFSPNKIVMGVQDEASEVNRPGSFSSPLRQRRRLTERLRAEVIAAYEFGLTSRQAAERFGVGKATVLKILNEAGVTIRPQGRKN